MIDGAAGDDILLMPPFPGARRRALSVPAVQPATGDLGVGEAIGLLVRTRVGGRFWGARPAIPTGATILAHPRSAAQARTMAAACAADRTIVLGRARWAGAHRLSGVVDPWHLLDHVLEVHADADDPILLFAAAAGRVVRPYGAGRFAGLSDPAALADVVRRHLLDGRRYRDPFTGDDTSFVAVVRQLGAWRDLIDANRPISHAAGIARWKRRHVVPLLWGGGAVRFGVPTLAGREAAIWRSRTSMREDAALRRSGAPLHEVEDGFIRSVGLGADCVPPLSIVVDRAGAHFDPSRASDLETLLRDARFDAPLLARARALRQAIRHHGLSKYALGGAAWQPRSRANRVVLVTGQVEDDRSVLLGGGGLGNLDLLRQARRIEPNAHIVYKPHPDVEAGHRRGAISDAVILELADEIVRDAAIPAMLDAVDAVHVLTSLTGFEALLRDREVVTHGVPFYAGWGLTRDLGAVPARRDVTRTLDELVAATLILYPRYLDPVSGLPCPPEVLLERIVAGEAQSGGALVAVRRLIGRLRYQSAGHAAA